MIRASYFARPAGNGRKRAVIPSKNAQGKDFRIQHPNARNVFQKPL
jgi:hypothetical protein